MNFLKFKNKSKQILGYSFSLTSAFAILKSDLISEKFCDFLEKQSKRHINNPLNSKKLEEEKSYMKEIVPKIAVEKYNFDKFREKFFELIPAEKIRFIKKGQDELENLMNSIKPRVLEISVVVRQCKNIINKYRSDQNKLELEISRLQEEEKNLKKNFEEKVKFQRDCIEKSQEQSSEYEKNLKLIFAKVNEKMDDYLTSHKNYNEIIKNGKFEKLEKLRNEFAENLKQYDLGILSNEEMEKIFKEENSEKMEEIKQNIGKMSLLHNEFKAKEIEMTKECLLEESKKLEDKLLETMDTLNIYDQNYRNFTIKKNDLAQYESGLKILKDYADDYLSNRKDIYERKVRQGMQNMLYKFHSDVKVNFTKIMDEKSSLMKLNLQKFFNSKILSLEENHKFLDGIYTTRMKESISFMKFIMNKFNTDNPFNNTNDNEEALEKEKNKNPLEFLGKEVILSDKQRLSLLNNLFSNYEKIGKFAKKFDDEFLSNLTKIILRKNKENVKDYITKQELLRHFSDYKEDIFFELFYNYDAFYSNNNKGNKNILRFYFSTLLSEFGNIWLEFFHPDFSVTKGENKDFLNQFKAVNYIYYYIKKEDYTKAYSYLEYIHPTNKYVNRLKPSLEKLSKTQVYCDIIEAHVEGTQKYKDELLC